MAQESLIDDGLFQEFQRELETLETFRDQHRSLYGFSGLERGDPDVQRMIEALAFFTARTRRTAERALARHEHRALEQLFPYLLSPMPSMAMLMIENTRAIPDAKDLPAGTEILVNASAPGEARLAAPAQSTLRFRTLRTLRILPIEIEPHSVELLKQGEAGWDMRMTVSAAAHQLEPPRRLNIYISPQGDMVAALRLHHALRRCLTSVSYTFIGPSKVERTTKRMSFDPPPDDASVDPLANPLEGFRRFLHFPLSALCLSIPVEGGPSDWSAIKLRLHLSAAWSAALSVGPRSFTLHAVPMINLHRASADPVAFDGTKSRVEVAHPEPGDGHRARDLLGVYRAAPEGLVPILPDALVKTGESYAVDVTGHGLERQMWLDLDMPSAVDRPTTIVADAEWYQPAAARLFDRALTALPATRHLERVRFHLALPLQEPSESPLSERRDRLSRLLELSGQSDFDASDLAFLLDMMGAANNDLFARITKSIASVQVERGADTLTPSGQRAIVALTLKRLPPTLRPAADLLFARLPEFLAAWLDEAGVTVRVRIEGDEQDIEIVHTPQGEDDRGR